MNFRGLLALIWCFLPGEQAAAKDWPIQQPAFLDNISTSRADTGKLTLKGGWGFPYGNFTGASEMSPGAEIFFSLGEPVSFGLIYSHLPVIWKKQFAITTREKSDAFSYIYTRFGLAEPVVNQLSANIRFGGTDDYPFFLGFGAGVSQVQFDLVYEATFKTNVGGQWLTWFDAYGINKQTRINSVGANAAIGVTLPLPAGFELGVEGRVYGVRSADLKKLFSGIETINKALAPLMGEQTPDVKFGKTKKYDLFFVPSLMLSYRF